MVLIEIQKEDYRKVFGILIHNGKFRAFGEKTFDIVEHPEQILEKLTTQRIPYKLLSPVVPRAQ